jgi:signal transduction histidine kinase
MDWRRRRSEAALALSLALSPAVAGAGSTFVRPASLLVVDPGEAGRPAFLEFMAGFRDGLRESAGSEPVAVHTVNLDLWSLESAGARQTLDALVRERFRLHRIGVIVALREATFESVFGWRDELWPDAPVVAVAEDAEVQQALAAPRCRVLHVSPGIEQTARVALALLPGARHVVFVGDGEYRGASGASGLVGLRAVAPSVVPLLGLPMPELLDRVAALPEHSVILLGTFNSDGAGRRFATGDALDLVTTRANAPVFVNISTLVGRGAVGGAVVDLAKLGRFTADAVVGQLRGEPATGLTAANVTRLLFDGRAMDRWGLRDSALPAGSEILHRRPTLWQQHRQAVLAGVTIAVLQSVAIAGLLLERRRRHEAERVLRRLSARLMTAQEDETRRIARDLHDDVCQRLVLMALDVDLLEGHSVRASGGRTAAEVSQAARVLSEDVQRIAYRLHPASLDRLGLLAAARRFAADAAGRAEVALEMVVKGWPEKELPPDVSLVLYRVMQEAVQNVLRHSGARKARVVFEGAPAGVSVRVEDDGVGFDPLAVAGTGLGFVGMRERLRPHGGQLKVASAPGRGAVVEAWLPASSLAPVPAEAAKA